MKRSKEKERPLRKLRLLLLTFCLVIIGITGLLSDTKDTPEAYATSVQEISSMEDFYTKLADQVYRREVLEYYTVKNHALGTQIVHSDLASFQSHVNPADPLRSGCYLCYYLKTIYFTYSGTQLKVMVTYPYQKGEMDRHFENMDRLAEQMKGKSDYETVKNVHDYLIKNFEYDYRTSMENHTDIDGFRDKTMVCSGYSLAAYYLLNKVGIKTNVITGSAGEELGDELNHMWNMVQVEGKWYNLDVTWDDQGGTGVSYTYFLKSDQDFPKHRRLGAYNTERYNTMVAEDSYPMPSVPSYKWLIIGLVGATIIFFLLTVKGKHTEEEEEEDKDYYMDPYR